ncbi:response regulator [Blastopirellula retiformator]|uniref:DNA-binding response regulator MtrA n=1 Tax=Blastopirellula retiformator TaxID=2527970 RepID=A0A5C5V603_9BACT|nr:response regulator [Blastopirellula retiformator]TWT33182.1 DNA-binding response regulator MtrA [Blastopirellula retiformator]
MDPNQRRILHIDDDPSITRLMRARLKRHDYFTDELNDPTCWRGALVNGGYRVVLLDVEMPQMNGLEVVQQIKRFDIGIAVIMFTSKLKMSIVLEALGYGAEFCFFKPAEDLQPIIDAFDASFNRITHWHQAASFAAQQLRIEQKTYQIKHKSEPVSDTSVAGQFPPGFEWSAFENYLLKRGAISPQLLELARAAFNRSVKPIGQIALHHRYISVADLMQVLQRQTETQTRFGDTAVEFGFLTNEQVEELLNRQKHLSITPQEAIYTVGAVTPAHLSRYLADFLRDIEAAETPSASPADVIPTVSQLTKTFPSHPVQELS